MAKIIAIKRNVQAVVAALSTLLLSTNLLAQQASIEFYENDNVTNQVPYFDNRFRIDAQVDELTLLFYRKSGTPPIILVQPDGTKLKVNQATEKGIEWFDDRTFDMIKLKKPMPGPWQAIGDILPNSRIMIVSDVTLAIDPLPEVLLQGETIKMVGTLLNGEKAIDNPSFRDVITLDVDFFSTNNSAFDNFGSEPVKLASFRDDGYELDEYSGDGLYTGEFELDFSPGEWLPIYRIKMPMASRDLQQQPVIIRTTPISLSAELTDDVNKSHNIIFTIDPTFVDPDSIILQGKVTYPDRQVEPFSIMEGKGETRSYAIPYTEGGIHRVKVSAFGKTIEGREFRLVVPEYSFNVERLDGMLLEGSELNNADQDLPTEQQQAELAAAKAQALEDERMRLAEEAQAQQQQTYLMIALGNVAVIIFAAIIFFVGKRRKKKK